MYETSHQSRFDARYWMLGAGALGRPRGMVWGGRMEEGSGWGTHVYLQKLYDSLRASWGDSEVACECWVAAESWGEEKGSWKG